jgi:RNA polymerase sigma-70 factor (ECF subfamily)
VDPETRFRVVFNLAYGPLCRYARHRGLDGPDAEDLVAQVLEVAWRRIDEVPADEPLPWLYAVARNLWRNQARRDRRRREILHRFRLPVVPETRTDPAALDPGVLRAALDSLSAQDQELLRLVAWDGLTPSELAVVFGCSPVAARTRLHRARARLAKRAGISPDAQRAGSSGHKQGDSTEPVEVPR